MTMNKLTLLSILVATIAIAGIFALMPVYEASTVHTTIAATAARIVEVDGSCTIATDIAADCDRLHVNIAAGADFILLSIKTDVGDGSGTGTASANIGVLTVNGNVTTLDPTVADFPNTDPEDDDGAGVFGLGAGANTITAAIAELNADDLDVADTVDVTMYMLIESEAVTPTLTLDGTV